MASIVSDIKDKLKQDIKERLAFVAPLSFYFLSSGSKIVFPEVSLQLFASLLLA